MATKKKAGKSAQAPAKRAASKSAQAKPAGRKAVARKPVARKKAASAKSPAKRAPAKSTRAAPSRKRAAKLVASGKVMRAIEDIWAASRRGEHYPAAWKQQLTMDEGYLVQLGLLARHVAAGHRQAGWKVGLTAQAVREQIGVFEPVLGFLLAAGHLHSGLSIPYRTLIDPRIENELCLTIGHTLRGPGVTQHQARAAIVAAAAAFELVENRGDFAADMPLAVADNVQQKAFITGPHVALAPGRRLADIGLEVRHNGVVVDRAKGSEVMGDPAASVAWLANKLAEFGLALETGMRVMSGSFTKQVILRPGDRVEARFDGMGSVSARFP